MRSISIAGQPYPIDVSADEIEIRHTLRLSAGTNRIPISVTDIAGREYFVELELSTDLDGPAVSFDEPVILPGVVRGVVYDPSGVSHLEISGLPVPVVDDGEGIMRFQIRLMEADLASSMLFECQDNLGNITKGNLPLRTVVASEMHSEIVYASAPERVRITKDIDAIFVGGRLAALTLAAAGEKEATVEFTNLQEGMHFLKDEIIVALKVSAPSPIASLEINGSRVHTMPGRRHQSVSRRIRIEQKGVNVISAILQDTEGRRSENQITVERDYTELEQVGRRLSVALLGTSWAGSSPAQEGWSEFIRDQLNRTLNEGKRFTVLSRDALPAVLAEQELSALTSSKRGRIQLGQITPAELLVVGKLRGSEENLEIVLQVVDSSTGETMAYADVSGPARSEDDLLDLVYDLALRFEQEFPRIQGQIIDVLSQRELLSDLSSRRLRRNMRCIVYRLEEIIHPATGESLGAQQHVIAEGTLEVVQEKMATILLDAVADRDAQGPVEVSDLVVTK